MVASQNDGDRSGGGDNTLGNGEHETAVYTVSVSGVGYRNEGYKEDGADGIPPEPTKPPALPAPEDDTQSRKFKLSRSEKWRILKNIGTVSIAFMVQFTAFQGTANLQSSINAHDGLGTVSLSAIYAALVLSCIFVPTFLIKRLTVKWTLCLSMLCYAPYIGSQFYPRFYTLVPAGVLLGLGAAPMWAAKATYLTQVGGVYAKLTDQPADAIVVRFFGFFFLAWQTAELWGNLISSLVLSEGEFGGDDGGNSTTLKKISNCGANFCVIGGGADDPLKRPPDSEIYEISAIYLTCVIVAVIIVALFVDPLSRYGEKQRRADSQEISGIQLLSATAYQLKKRNQQLLIPITVWIGMEQAFIGADFTQAYISCALGVQKVGYVMICFGVVNAGCSLLFGSVMKFVGRQPLMALGAIVHAALIGVLLVWKPHPENAYVFFTVSGLWGVGDAVWQTQVNGLYGTLFRRNKEAAFSNYRLWESAGFVVAYAYSTHLCARMKLYVMLTVLIIGTVGYIIVEILHRRKQKRLKALAEDPKAAQAAAEANQPEETDDEKDDIDDDIIITHL
ncbi:UNC93-like protein [Chelonus insularis]|uniref:UNC93-like protein n=1 Tax=Chelonus insularis TaxID=460826 RepID=UPI001588E569|nr:UNC93-like protein [Chelonus insularis]XP_034941433.1 UNC93-like protein [Chelonus insularis]XP_034941434.1 UNC93-like protein [Chelonus insularis]XP_034941436.1 UNC93-like protein [Chelonus insularis]XP_034941437.1 UNC93-like protein [Chelonus insularis]